MGGYSISIRGQADRTVVSVRIEKERFLELVEHMMSRALRASIPELVRDFRAFSFPAFAPVRKQVFWLVRRLNERRHVAGLECIPFQAVVPRWRA